MAGERTLPGISLTGYWDAGDNTWKAGMDENLRKLSVFVQLRVLSATTPLPLDDSNSSGVANGDIYIMPASDSNSFQSSNSAPLHGDIAVFDNGGWVFYTPLTGFRAYVIDQSTFYRFNGTAWVVDADNALNVAYDSGETGDSNSTQTTVAAALDDLYARIRSLSIGAVDAYSVSYSSGDNGDSNSAETTAGGALDDLYERSRDLDDRVTAVEAATGGISFSTITASFTLTAADDKKFYYCLDSSNSPDFIDIGIPEDALEDVADGFTVSAVQIGDSQIRFVAIEDSNSPAAAVLIYPADMQPQTRGKNSVITAVKTHIANEWLVFGDLEPV